MKKLRAHLKSIIFTLILLFTCNTWAAESATVNLLLSPQQTLIRNVLGNPNGDVTMILFTDYNCGYCKVVDPSINSLIHNDHKLRVLMIEYPVVAPTSEFAARAALAAGIQGKYLSMHKALMAYKGSLTSTAVLNIADKLKLNINKLTADMESTEVKKQLANSFDIANTLQVPGTPTFIIEHTLKNGETSSHEPYVNFGYQSYSDLENAIRSARKS